MPIVALIAKKTIKNNPDLGLSVIDLIVLLWLYSNPYDTKKRQLSSIRTVLKMCETLQTPGKGIELTDEELTQIILGSLERLKGKKLVFVRSAGRHFVKCTLTDAGVGLVRESMNSPSLRRVIAEFGNNP